jgi:hypothetical protein
MLCGNASKCLLEVESKPREVRRMTVFNAEMMCENVLCIKKILVNASKCLKALLLVVASNVGVYIFF